MSMSVKQDDDDNIALRLVGAIVFVVVASVLGYGAYQGLHKRAPAAAAQVALPEDGPSVVVQDGVVKFYFGNASAELAPAAAEALVEVVREAQSGKTLLVSGFHDASGDPALNEELAKQRALAVRSTLLLLGVSAERIELVKPEVSTGTGTAQQARRVEVRAR